MDVTIVNLSQDQFFNGIITLIFTDSSTPVAPLPDRDLSITIKGLHPNDRVTKQIRFTLPTNSSAEVGCYFQFFKLDGTPYFSVNNTPYRSSEYVLKVFPIPHVRTFILAVIGSASFLTTLITSWDQVKKFLGL
jgi:hypothetical protein